MKPRLSRRPKGKVVKIDRKPVPGYLKGEKPYEAVVATRDEAGLNVFYTGPIAPAETPEEDEDE